MENKYTIKFNNKIPIWESLQFENSNNNNSYPIITIHMEVYEKDILIYSIILKIIGHYYYCGSQNFEYENNNIEKTIITLCDNDITLLEIYHQLDTNYRNILNNTVLDIDSDYTRIFEYLYNF